MALSWNAGPQGEGMVADRDLYLDKSQNVLVEERDAASLLCAKGREIYADEVLRLGLSVVDGRVVQSHAQADGDAGPAVEETRTNVLDGPGSDFSNASWESAPESHGESEG